MHMRRHRARNYRERVQDMPLWLRLALLRVIRETAEGGIGLPKASAAAEC